MDNYHIIQTKYIRSQGKVKKNVNLVKINLEFLKPY